ncbi:Hypothetical protein A7982_04758 [Minicystis rosea]|nr:Hypothetical protein A7982_04758 [Minicystis rosea]
MKRTLVSAALALAAALLSPKEARADGDGVYGRLEGDLGLRLGAGAALSAGGPMLAVEAGFRYLCTAGLFVHYTDAVGTNGPRIQRSIAGGIEIAPLFLARYLTNLQSGKPYLDLFVDSFAFGLGAFWDEPRMGSWPTKPGVELSLGFAFPILPRASGPYLGVRGALRWRDGDLTGNHGGPDIIERGALLSITLGWQQLVSTHLVDSGDGRP